MFFANFFKAQIKDRLFNQNFFHICLGQTLSKVGSPQMWCWILADFPAPMALAEGGFFLWKISYVNFCLPLFLGRPDLPPRTKKKAWVGWLL